MKNKEVKSYDQLIQEMRGDAKAHHGGHLKDEFFNGLGFNGLLAYCHPSYRRDYIENYKEIEREEAE